MVMEGNILPLCSKTALRLLWEELIKTPVRKYCIGGPSMKRVPKYHHKATKHHPLKSILSNQIFFSVV